MSARRCLIIDRAFVQAEGHHRSANELLCRVAGAKGLKPTLLCNREASPDCLDGVEVRPVFHGTPYSGFRKGDLAVLGVLNREALTDFRRVPKDLLQPGAVFFVHTTNESEVYGLARWMSEAVLVDRMSGVLGLMMPSGLILDESGGVSGFRDSASAIIYQQALQLIEPLSEHIVPMGIGTSIAREYEHLSGRAIARGPALIPGIGRPIERRNLEGPPRILLFVGDAKLDKGFHLIPATVRGLSGVDQGFEAWVQISGSLLDRYGAIIKEVEAAVAGDERFRMIRGRLDEADYQSMWMDADLAVMAYDPKIYSHQTSGLCWEAMNYATPAVVTKGTWHERELDSYGFLPVLADSFWPDSIVAAISGALGNRDAIRAQWTANRPLFVSKNDPGGFVDPLMVHLKCGLTTTVPPPFPDGIRRDFEVGFLNHWRGP